MHRFGGLQLTYVLDCLDGAIARTFDEGSFCGVGVDASADVTSMVSVVGVSVLAATLSGSDAVTPTQLAMSGVARTAGPLWTVVDKMNVGGCPPTATSGRPRLRWAK